MQYIYLKKKERRKEPNEKFKFNSYFCYLLFCHLFLSFSLWEGGGGGRDEVIFHMLSTIVLFTVIRLLYLKGII